MEVQQTKFRKLGGTYLEISVHPLRHPLPILPPPLFRFFPFSHRPPDARYRAEYAHSNGCPSFHAHPPKEPLSAANEPAEPASPAYSDASGDSACHPENCPLARGMKPRRWEFEDKISPCVYGLRQAFRRQRVIWGSLKLEEGVAQNRCG
jgi:hypothetical protein